MLLSLVIVALFARAWIEIFQIFAFRSYILVALFARAWIEMEMIIIRPYKKSGRPLCEGVD